MAMFFRTSTVIIIALSLLSLYPHSDARARSGTTNELEGILAKIKKEAAIKEKDVALCEAMGLKFSDEAKVKLLFSQCTSSILDIRKRVSQRGKALKQKHAATWNQCEQDIKKINTPKCQKLMKSYYTYLVDKKVNIWLNKLIKLAKDECKRLRIDDDSSGNLPCAFSFFNHVSLQLKNKEKLSALARAASRICTHVTKADTGRDYKKCYEKVALSRKRGEYIVPAPWIVMHYGFKDKARKWCKQISSLIRDIHAFEECVATRQFLLTYGRK